MSLAATIAAYSAAHGDSRIAARLSNASAARQEMGSKLVSRRLTPQELDVVDDRCVFVGRWRRGVVFTRGCLVRLRRVRARGAAGAPQT